MASGRTKRWPWSKKLDQPQTLPQSLPLPLGSHPSSDTYPNNPYPTHSNAGPKAIASGGNRLDNDKDEDLGRPEEARRHQADDALTAVEQKVARLQGGTDANSAPDGRFEKRTFDDTLIQPLKDEIKNLRDDFNKSTNHHTCQYRDELNKATETIRHLEHHKSRTQEDAIAHEREFALLQRQLADAQNLAKIRGKELLGAQVFLHKADTLSFIEVSEKLSNLNDEIFQAACFIAETLIPKTSLDDQRDVVPNSTIELWELLGSNLTTILLKESRKEVKEINPLLAQVVLQVTLTVFICRSVQAWFPQDEGKSLLFEAIYKDMRSNQDQAVYGRWRSLTRAYCTIDIATWLIRLRAHIGRVVGFAGWTAVTPSSEATQDIEKRLTSTFNATQDIRRAIGEKVTSVDLEVFVVTGGTQFTTGYMEDAFGDIIDAAQLSHGPSDEVVAGTVGLGLKKLMKEEGPNGLPQFTCLHPAKVALESTLLEVLEPPPPRKNRP